MTIDELAAAIRAYVGEPPTPGNPDGDRWYIDIDSMASDGEIWQLAEGIVRAAEERRATSLQRATRSPR